MRLTSSAPTRIDLAGGTIDIWPLYLFHDGATTLNAAISLRAHAEIASRTDGAIELRSLDTDRVCRVAHWSEFNGTSDLPLLALLARHYRLENATLTTRGESPAGAGIAGSSALTIAVCGALARWTQSPSDPEHLLPERAQPFDVDRVDDHAPQPTHRRRGWRVRRQLSFHTYSSVDLVLTLK